MKIGIDARFYRAETGGIGRYTQNLIRELSKIDQKNQYTIFITQKDEAEYEQTTHNLQLTTNNFQKRIISITHYSVAEQTKFLKILNQENFDLVHFLNFNHPILYKRPFITTIHDLTMLLHPAGSGQKSLIKRWAFKKVMKNAVKNSKAVVAVSEATKKDCAKYLKADPKKIKVIYEAVSPAFQQGISNFQFPISNEFPISNFSKPNKLMKSRQNSILSRILDDKIIGTKKLTKPYLLFVSQWRPHKGLPELIKTFEILKDPTSPKGLRGASNLDLQLIITGKPNKDFPEIPIAIRQSLFAKDIITPGFVTEEELKLLYQNADAFIFPSFYEGFGLGPLEAMACGTPVISSNLSCMPEILGNAAEYFDPNNINEMADIINKVLSDKSLQEKMKKTGLEQVKKYSWAKMAKKTLRVYNSVH